MKHHRNGHHGSSIGGKRKPWQIKSVIDALHKHMKVCVGEWCDQFFMKEAPEAVRPHLMARDKVGAQWLDESGYRWEHKRIRHISDFSFAMVFEMLKNDVVVNQFEFIVNHDGGFKDPHVIAAMIFTGGIVTL